MRIMPIVKRSDCVNSKAKFLWTKIYLFLSIRTIQESCENGFPETSFTLHEMSVHSFSIVKNMLLSLLNSFHS